jgi:hypothetical protein
MLPLTHFNARLEQTTSSAQFSQKQGVDGKIFEEKSFIYY